MRSLTPIKKNQKAPEATNDPYVFQEPDESPTTKFETPTKGILEIADDDVGRSPKESKTTKAMKREEPEKTAVESAPTDNIPNVPGEVFKILTPVNSGDSGEEPEKSKLETSSAASKDEEDKDKKPFLQMTDQYATLFPHLASLRAQQPDSPSSSPFPHISEPSPMSNIISSASFISEIVESTIIKSQSDPEEKETKDSTVADADLDEKKDEEKSSKESLTPSKKNKNKKPKKRSMRKNPSHKSREVVTDSDTDSESEDAAKSKPITPSRRKTTDSDRPAPSSLKRLKHLESDDDTSPKKRVKRRKDDDTSLMCEETIPRSPQPQGSSESIASANPDERSASCLEMPFATVPQSVAQPRGRGPVASAQALDCSPP